MVGGNVGLVYAYTGVGETISGGDIAAGVDGLSVTVCRLFVFSAKKTTKSAITTFKSYRPSYSSRNLVNSFSKAESLCLTDCPSGTSSLKYSNKIFTESSCFGISRMFIGKTSWKMLARIRCTFCLCSELSMLQFWMSTLSDFKQESGNVLD